MAGLFALGGRPVVLAHRGGGALALENSPTAFANAERLGVGHIETDVRATLDGIAVLIHDATLDRTTNGRGAIASSRWADLAAARLRNGDAVPSLAAMLAAHPALAWNVDVKSDDAVLPFLAAVGAAGAWSRVCAASFSGRRLRRLRRLAGPRLATATTPGEVAAIRLAATSLTASSFRGADGPVAAQVPIRYGQIEVITPGFVRRAHRAGIAIHAWTINDPVQMRQLLDLGVDGLVTDRPDLALAVVAEMGLAGAPNQSRHPGGTW